MIIKSMARKTHSFGQLAEYLNKEHKDLPCFSHNLLSHPLDTQSVVDEFEQNAKLLPARKNGNLLYHEVIVLPPGISMKKKHQFEALLEIAEKYVELRSPAQLVFGRIHDDTYHPHLHLMISSNDVGSTRRKRLSKKAFGDIQREVERFKNERFPELADISHYQKSRTQRGISQREFELHKRTGKITKRQYTQEQVKAIFGRVQSSKELEAELKKLEFELYQRGKTFGVQHATGMKFRLKTLGLEKEHALLTAKEISAQERAEELAMLRAAKARTRDDDLER